MAIRLPAIRKGRSSGIRGRTDYMPTMPSKSPIPVARPRRAPPVLVCRKCLARAADGKAMKRALKSELKLRGAAEGVKRARLVMTGCLGICPKRAVVAASAATLQRGEYLLLSDTQSAADAAAILMGDEGAAAPYSPARNATASSWVGKRPSSR